MPSYLSNFIWVIGMMASISLIAALFYACLYNLELKLTPKGEGIFGGLALLFCSLLITGSLVYLFLSPLIAFAVYFHCRSRTETKSVISAVAVLVFTNGLTFMVGAILSAFWNNQLYSQPYAGAIFFGSLLLYPNLMPVFFWVMRSLRLRARVDVAKEDLH